MHRGDLDTALLCARPNQEARAFLPIDATDNFPETVLLRELTERWHLIHARCRKSGHPLSPSPRKFERACVLQHSTEISGTQPVCIMIAEDRTG